jgi:hypothetical protein
MCIKVYSQDNYTLEKLKAPSMPSAAIIGLQVNEVNRPKSLNELETAVFSNFLNQNQSIIIPDNFALEVNPFMLSGRKNFDYHNYLNDNAADNIWQNLSLSVASTNKYILKDSASSNAMGFSVRTIIFNGKPRPKVLSSFYLADLKNAYIQDIKSFMPGEIEDCFTLSKSISYIADTLCPCVIQKFNADEINNLITNQKLNNEQCYRITAQQDTIIKSIFIELSKDTSFTNSFLSENNNNKALRKFQNAFDSLLKQKEAMPALEKLIKNLQNVKTERYGLRMEVDLAFSLNFPTNNFNYSFVPGYGFWTNISYQPEGIEGFSFIGLVRYIINSEDFIKQYQPLNNNFVPGNFVDIGTRLVYDYNKFSVGIEYTYRFNKSKATVVINGNQSEQTVNNDTRKYLINMNYNITDNINLSYNFGKDFDNITPLKRGDLISGLSINFGFGSINADDLLKSALSKQ